MNVSLMRHYIRSILQYTCMYMYISDCFGSNITMMLATKQKKQPKKTKVIIHSKVLIIEFLDVA